MAQDFRDLLKESMRNGDTGERWFEDFELGDVFFLSIQASSLHASTPEALLEDIRGYEAFQVTMQIKSKVPTCGRRGAWQHLEQKDWWSRFESDSPIIYMAENVPAAVVQQIFEDMLAVVEGHPEIAPRKAACGGLKPC